jgi:DNA (cytosine-5)-methyltransferase 1
VTAVKLSLVPPRVGACVELFSGLGGLAIGLDRAGWSHELLVERDPQAVATLRGNDLTRDWPLHDADLRDLDLESAVEREIDLLAAGVPCQPFSQAGAHAGPADERNMFPETFAAIRQLKPKAVLIENVRGLARPAFKPFVEYIVDHLQLPDLARKQDEGWPDHHRRLQKALKRSAKDPAERYVVEWRPVCVADYGVPQRRVRVIMVAVRGDLAERWSWPEPTHGHEVLLLDQLDGFYWAEHDLLPRSPILAPATRKRVRRIAHPTQMARWRTLRDALRGLPDPVAFGGTPELNWHSLWPGARLYRGHRGSELDRPSKTIKAGVHGVAGGEHIVHLDSGEFRYLTVRECMRVQDLPDRLEIDAPRTVAIRQIGNAVPPTIGEVFGLAIARAVGDEGKALAGSTDTANHLQALEVAA